MTDVNIEEVLNCADLLINDVINAERLDEQNSWDNYFETILTTKNDLNACNDELEKRINEEKEWFSTFKANLKEHEKSLGNIEDELRALKTTETEKLREHEKVCKKIESLKEKMSERTKSFMAVSQDLKNKEDTILTYKLLTGTTFLYNTKNVEGVVSKGSTTVPFSFDPTKIPAKNITKKLWKLVLEEEHEISN